MKCPKCQFDNRESAKFCNECGHNFDVICPECNTPNRVGSKFCDECCYDLKKTKEIPSINYSDPQSYTPKHLTDKILTTRSSIEGERKLVTVLFADVANYTAISEKLDPEEVHHIMDGCFKILMDEVHLYEGTINQFTGDGVMALFGAPISHEDHAQRGCRAALAIQKAMDEYDKKIRKDYKAKFKLRIGLNSGPVIVGAIGDDLRMDYTAVGDTTNLAMRMESMATPGNIKISENTYRLIKAYFDCEDLGSVSVKGKEKPQKTYNLIKSSDVQTRIEASVSKGLVSFVGRKNSMAAIQNAWDKAVNGSGQILGVVGEAGVGKSRLLLEFRNSLTNGDLNHLEGRCLHYGGSMAYLPFLDILRAFFEIEEGQREHLINKNIKEKLTTLDKELLLDSVPAFQELLSLKIEEKFWLKLEPKIRSERTFEALRNLFIRLSEEKPLIIAVEDLHWMDKTSEEYLNYFIDSMAHNPILLILLYRPEYTHQWGSKSYYSKIGLDQLTMESSAELVSAILEGGEVASELNELILNRSAGNPLFLEEFTHTLLENGSIERKNNQFVLSRKISDIQVPDTIQGIIAARMDRLEENLKRTMQVASVIGRDFAFRILQTITGMKEELKSSLINLQGLEFIYEKTLFPELEYIFKHALTQEVAYNSLLLKRRKEIHEKIGMAIEELYQERLGEFYEMLAYHFIRSENKMKALEYIELSNQKSIDLNAMEDAKNYFEIAMQLLDEMPENDETLHYRFSFLINQLFVFQLLLQLPEYYDILNKYIPKANKVKSSELLGAFYARLGTCQWWFGELEKSTHTHHKSKKYFQNIENPYEVGTIFMSMQWCYMWKGDFGKALALKESAMNEFKKNFEPRGYVYSKSATSLAHSQLGQWDSAEKDGKKGLKAAEDYSNNSLISFAAVAIALATLFKGDTKKALQHAELSVKKAPTVGDEVYAKSCLSWALCRSGQAEKGAELATEISPMFQAVRFLPGETYAKIIAGEGFFFAGDYDRANQWIKEGLSLAENCGMKFFIGWAYRLLGEIDLKINTTAAAVSFEKSISMLQEIKAENELALAYAGYGRNFIQQNQIVEAREFLTKALEIFERLGTLIEPEKINEELAVLRGT